MKDKSAPNFSQSNQTAPQEIKVMKKHPFWFGTLTASVTLATVLSGEALAASKKSGPGSWSAWSSATAISPVCQPDPTRGSQLNDIAVNASGLAVAAWDQYTYNAGGPCTIGVAVQSGGQWGAPFTISGTTGFSLDPRVAVGADGTMAVSWVHQDPTLTQQEVQVAVRWPNGTTWTAATLAQAPIGGVAIAGFVPVGVDASGNLTAAWTLWDGARHIVQSATLLKGGTWSTPTTLSGPTTDGLYLCLAVNAAGDAAVAYTTSPYTSASTGTFAQYSFRSGPTGAWTAPTTVSETIPSSVGYVSNPQIALDAMGLATVIYSGYGVEAVRQLGNGSWTQPQTVLQAPNQFSSFQSIDFALDGAGNAVVAASIFDGTINVNRASTWAALGDGAGNWGAQQRLTDPTASVDACATRAAMSPDGTLVLVGWVDHYHGTVQVSQLANGVWSAAYTIGRATAGSAFQEVLGLDAGAGNTARAIWKRVASGTETMAASYRR